jgi:hypothetical protein
MYRMNIQEIKNHHYSYVNIAMQGDFALVCSSKYIMYLLKNNTWFCTFDNFSFLCLKITAVHKIYSVLLFYIQFNKINHE